VTVIVVSNRVARTKSDEPVAGGLIEQPVVWRFCSPLISHPDFSI
jgi:hypothetical protein